MKSRLNCSMELSACTSEIGKGGSREVLADSVPNEFCYSAGIVFGRRPVLLAYNSRRRCHSVSLVSHFILTETFRTKVVGAGGRGAKLFSTAFAQIFTFSIERCETPAYRTTDKEKQLFQMRTASCRAMGRKCFLIQSFEGGMSASQCCRVGNNVMPSHGKLDSL